MTTRVRGIVLGVVQCALVLSIAGKYAWDRERLPRVWVRTVVVDPNLPLRGRYLALRLEVMPAGALVNYGPAKLSAENGQLVARAASEGERVMHPRTEWVLNETVPYFVPEHWVAPSPEAGEIWVEVSVPANGPPRAIRLGLKKTNSPAGGGFGILDQ